MKILEAPRLIAQLTGKAESTLFASAFLPIKWELKMVAF